MRKVNVLLLSAGGLTGTFLIRHFRKSQRYRYHIVAADCNPVVPAAILADEFFVVPKLNEEAYPKNFEQIVEKGKIDLIIPITSRDVDFFAERNFYRNKMLTVDDSLNKLLSNKKSCYAALNEIGLNTPAIICGEPKSFPVFFKPEVGSGSKGSMIVSDCADYDYCKRKYKNGLLTNYLEGREFTVDCLFDRNGVCMGYHNRERKKTVAGGAVVSTSVRDSNLDMIVERLADNFHFEGPVNFQYILRDNQYYIIDFNTRFASGGLPLSVACGFDIPEKLADLVLEGKTEPYRQRGETDYRTMIRYYEELFLNNENHI